MKYIGVDENGSIFAFNKKPKWWHDPGNDSWWTSGGWNILFEPVPSGVLPPLEPCCLYKITKDAYVMIEDRRK